MLRARPLPKAAVIALLAAAWPAASFAQSPTAANTAAPVVPPSPSRERVHFVRAKLVRTAVVKSGAREIALLALEETGPSAATVPSGFEAVPKERACRFIYFAHEAAAGDADALAKAVGGEVEGVPLREKPECGEILVEWTGIVPYDGLRVGGVSLRPAELGRGTDLSELAGYLAFFEVPGRKLFGRGAPPLVQAAGLLSAIGSKEALELAVRHDLIEPRSGLDAWSVPDKEEVFERGLVELGNPGYLEHVWQRSPERALRLVDEHLEGKTARALLIGAAGLHEPRMYDVLTKRFASASPELKELTLDMLGDDFQGPDDYLEPFLRANIPTTPVRSEDTAKRLRHGLQIFDRRRALHLEEPTALARTLFILSRGQRSYERSRFLVGARIALDGVVKDAYGSHASIAVDAGDYTLAIALDAYDRDAGLPSLAKGSKVRVEGRFESARAGDGTALKVTLTGAHLGPPKGTPRPERAADPGPWSDPPAADETAPRAGSGCGKCAVDPTAPRRSTVALALLGLAAAARRGWPRRSSALGLLAIACAVALVGCKKSPAEARASCAKVATKVKKESPVKPALIFRATLDGFEKPSGTSIATDGATVAVAYGSSLTAYDASSGKKKWSVETTVSDRALAVTGGAVLSVEATEARGGAPPAIRAGRIVARDAASGTERWSAKTEGVVEGLIVDHGRVVVAASNHSDDGVSTQVGAWSIDGGAPVFETQLLEVDCAWARGGPALLASCPALGYALDRGNGKAHWEKPTSGYGDGVLVADASTVFGGPAYRLEARRIDDGELRWTYKHKGPGSLNRRLAHVHGDALLVGLYEDHLPSDTPRRGKGTDDTRLIAIDTASGEEMWSHVVTHGGEREQDRRTLDSMAVDGGNVVFAADGGLQVLSLCEGTIREIETEHPPTSELVLSGPDVYYIEEPGALVHLRLP